VARLAFGGLTLVLTGGALTGCSYLADVVRAGLDLPSIK
jgi:hypothetical protein